MLLISHRGNLEGSSGDENHPDYVSNALNLGYIVEVDVFLYKSKIYLGHDEPLYEVDIDFISNPNLLVHCKNYEILSSLINKDSVHFFWHQNDNYTLTSRGWIWVFPGRQYDVNSIVVLPEKNNLGYLDLVDKCHGVCSDYIKKFKK
jgi:hypothetical protein